MTEHIPFMFTTDYELINITYQFQDETALAFLTGHFIGL